MSHFTQLHDARPPRGSRGFTLVELLVVITIIGILSSLATVGIMAAMRKARSTAVKLEIDQMSGKFMDYKQTHGSFPPNCLTTQSWSDRQQLFQARAKADLIAHFKKAFPRHLEPPQLFDKLVGRGDGALAGGMNPAEAVVFWLGGFSDDKRYPISGKGGPAYDPNGGVEALEDRAQFFPFAIERLGPRNAQKFFDESQGRFIVYNVPGLGSRRINFWTYTPKNLKKPFLYFDTSRYKPYRADGNSPVPDYDPLWEGISPLKRLSQASTTKADPRLFLQFANPDSFQILHPGIDDEWGELPQLASLSLANEKNLIVYPDGPFSGELADTLVNFSVSNLEDSEP